MSAPVINKEIGISSMKGKIQRIADQISDNFHPEKIVLFGSCAIGKPDIDSDIDLLVVMDYHGSARKQAVKILQNTDYHIPLDLIVRSRDQISYRIKGGDYFFRDLMKNGKTLYDGNLS